ncbi:MAG: uracil-DNA glycosylase [Actinobacteria bacterium]|nr:uracil-DNA glycosylase [Actinomycetota bacterium]
MEWLGRLRTKPAKVANQVRTIRTLDREIVKCDACPRLVNWREEVAETKRRAYINEIYWGKPVTGFGSADAKLLIIGLAPGAHGANRTGRIFTGDSSGDWLYGSLYRNGLATQASSIGRNDGQELIDTRITCAVRCAPPDNKPATSEVANCSHWLVREFELLAPTIRSYLALGGIAWRATLETLRNLDEELPRKLPKFGHGASFKFRGRDGNTKLVIGSYHPSQQNTFTGKLTRNQLDAVIRKAGRFAHAGKPL